MASKLVTDREKSSRAVEAAARTHAQEIASGLARELSPHLEAGEAMPDVALLVRLVGRKIAADAAAMVAADRAHERELADDAAPREARDESAAKVRAALVDGRAAVDAVYGPAGLKKLGLDPAVPEDPSVLASKAAEVIHALRDADVKLPKPRRASMKVDRRALADEIEGELPRLVKALAKTALEDREKEATLLKKQAAMSKNDRGFTRGAGLLSASCAYAGLDELAAKVRPSGRKPGQTAAAEQEEEVRSGAAPAGQESDA